MSKHLVRVTASVKVAGTIHDLGAFRTISDITFTSTRRKSTQAAGEKERVRRGRKRIDDVTLERENDGALDLDWLRQNRDCEGTVTYQPLDDDLNPRGKPIPVDGRLKDVVLGAGDAEDDGAPLDFRLVWELNGD